MTPFEEFYSAFPNKQAKERCKKYYESIGEEEHKEIMLALDAHKRWRNEAKKARHFLPEWCNAATWIYQKRYRDELPCSHSELKEKAAKNNRVCRCGKPATHRGKEAWVCAKCWYDDWHDEPRVLHYASLRKAEFKYLKVEKQTTWRAACLPVIWSINPGLAKLLGR